MLSPFNFKDGRLGMAKKGSFDAVLEEAEKEQFTDVVGTAEKMDELPAEGEQVSTDRDIAPTVTAPEKLDTKVLFKFNRNVRYGDIAVEAGKPIRIDAKHATEYFSKGLGVEVGG